jgi:hypothetical protein
MFYAVTFNETYQDHFAFPPSVTQTPPRVLQVMFMSHGHLIARNALFIFISGTFFCGLISICHNTTQKFRLTCINIAHTFFILYIDINIDIPVRKNLMNKSLSFWLVDSRRISVLEEA